MVSQKNNLKDKLLTAQRKLEEKDLILNTLIHHISHDLQQPITTVLGYIDLLKRKYHTELGEKGNTYVENISEAARNLTYYFERLLVYSRLGRNEEIEKLDLNPLVREIAKEVQNDLGESDVNHTTILVGSLPEIYAIKFDIKVLFKELLTNALLYRKESRPIEIKVDAQLLEDEMVEFVIRDNGVGITEKRHKDIFELFTRFHSTNNNKGLGLGLAMCKAVVEKYGGKIRVYSRPDHGSEFRFCIKNQINIEVDERV